MFSRLASGRTGERSLLNQALYLINSSRSSDFRMSNG